MSKLSREDRLALLDSEVYQELEMAEIRKQAQSLSDKIINSPTAQKAISDGIAKALQTNSADDWSAEHKSIRENIKKLPDHVLYEMFKLFDDEVEARDLNAADYEKEFEDEELNEDETDEKHEEDEMADVFAHVVAALTKIANDAADEGDTEAAYIVERAIESLK